MHTVYGVRTLFSPEEPLDGSIRNGNLLSHQGRMSNFSLFLPCTRTIPQRVALTSTTSRSPSRL